MIAASQNGPLACMGQTNGPLSISGRFTGLVGGGRPRAFALFAEKCSFDDSYLQKSAV